MSIDFDKTKADSACIPMRTVGPIKIIDSTASTFESYVPMATFEAPLWYSSQRGSKACNLAGGIRTVLISDFMTRSVVVEVDQISDLLKLKDSLLGQYSLLEQLVAATGRFVSLKGIDFRFIGRLAYIRISMTTAGASGHNMTTIAAEAVLDWVIKNHKYAKYVSISGNYCTDKKASAVNSILGRGKYVVAEACISASICRDVLKTSPQAIVDLNNKKNLIGSIAAGSLASANAHYANMLLAIYLATGQDAANIVEGSQGITCASLDTAGDGLVFSVTLPNLIVGVVGNGKHIPFVEKNLDIMGCLHKEGDELGAKSRRLAEIIAAAVLCGELSLMAAQTNPGELTKSHIRIERNAKLYGNCGYENRD
ncbi:MAG: hypothetical protein LBL30_02235 [Holosporales bacterium]|jgi:hydroxymethylglutaryl-CoA reductase (NADPH)|nr:hypothetical protein [Holosporales bacterium]